MSNAIQTIDNEANHLISIVSIAFDTAEMRRMNRALRVIGLRRGHEGNKSHNHELKADKRVNYFYIGEDSSRDAKAPRKNGSIVHLFLFINTPC